LEGVAFDLFDLYRAIRPYDTSEVILGAGKALQKSTLLPQIIADIFQKPLHITSYENALFGATIMAAVAVGALKDASDGISTITYDQRVMPIPANTTHYRQHLIPDRS
jgi:sugar (pentulose or hexulose) kinase